MEQTDKKKYQGAEFYIVSPGKGRKSFVVMARWGRGTAEQKTESLTLPGVRATNKLYIDGKLSREEAIEALTHLIKGLKGEDKKPKSPYLKANKTLVDDYWVKVYGPREIVARRSAYNRLLRAVKAVGNLPLATASDLEIFQAVREYEPNQALRKRIIATLSQLLKYIGRHEVQIPRIKKTRASVKHLSMDELTEVLFAIKDPGFALLCKAAFATGCRPGELFGLTGASFNSVNKTVFVADQIDMITGERKATKTGERRHVPILPELSTDLRDWIYLSDAEKLRIRKLRHSEEFRKAVWFALKGRRENFVFYDLRHSYAIHLLNKGISIDLVAQALGNSVTVCQEHYLGFVLTSGGLNTMQRMLNS